MLLQIFELEKLVNSEKKALPVVRKDQSIWGFNTVYGFRILLFQNECVNLHTETLKTVNSTDNVVQQPVQQDFMFDFSAIVTPWVGEIRD